MKLELSKSQKELLTFIHKNNGEVVIDTWMKTSTITSLITRQAIRTKVVNLRSKKQQLIKLTIQQQGLFLLNFKSPGRKGYYKKLKDVSRWRK